MHSYVFIANSIQSDTMNDQCSVYKTMDYIAKKWTVLILLELYKGYQNKNDILK